MRLMIGTPSADGWVHGHYMQSVLRAADHLRRHDVEFEYRLMRGHDLGLNRCRLLYESLQIGADYLLQVDSDTGFPADAPWRLLQWRRDMICIPYLGPGCGVDATIRRPRTRRVGRRVLRRWSGWRESNPHHQLGRLELYH